MEPQFCRRALVLILACQLLAAAAGCSSDEPKGRALPKAGKLVKVFDPGKDGVVNGMAFRGDGTLFVSTSLDVRAIPREGKHETVMTQAFGSLVTGKDTIYALGIRDGVVFELGPGRREQVALVAAAETAGPTDPGLDEPYSLAWDPKSETLLVADQHKIDRIDPRSRRIETVSGARGDESTRQDDGLPARDARWGTIEDIAVDPTDGALYLAAANLYRVEPSSGLVRYIRLKTAGIGMDTLAFDARTGDLFFSTSDLLGSGRVSRLARDGTVTIIVKALEESVRALALDPKDGALYIATKEAVFRLRHPRAGEVPIAGVITRRVRGAGLAPVLPARSQVTG